MNKSVCRCVCYVVISSIAFWCKPVLAQQKYEFSRRGGVTEFRLIERPALIDALAESSELVALSPDEFAQLKAYVVAVSQPRRMEKDGFYKSSKETQGPTSNGDAVSRRALADPVHVSMMFPKIDRVRDWQRLRMHFVYNEQLQQAAAQWQRAMDNEEQVEPRKTVAVQVGPDVRWFAVEDCRRSWTSRSSQGGALYLTPDGRFVLLTPYADWTGAPAKFVDERAAVIWLAMDGDEMPEELAQAAAALRLNLPADDNSP